MSAKKNNVNNLVSEQLTEQIDVGQIVLGERTINQNVVCEE